MNIKNNKGFSLLEVMVTVGIIGILVSVAVPAYNDYRDTAAKSSLSASLSSIEKAYNACMLVGSGTCNTKDAIGLGGCGACSDPRTPTSANSVSEDPEFCMEVTQQFGSSQYKGCVSIDVQSGNGAKTIGLYQQSGTTLTHVPNDSKFCYCKPTSGDAVLQPGGVVSCSNASACTGCQTTETAECNSAQGKCEPASAKCV